MPYPILFLSQTIELCEKIKIIHIISAWKLIVCRPAPAGKNRLIIRRLFHYFTFGVTILMTIKHVWDWDRLRNRKSRESTAKKAPTLSLELEATCQLASCPRTGKALPRARARRVATEGGQPRTRPRSTQWWWLWQWLRSQMFRSLRQYWSYET